jgi:hypothetical protein
MRDQLNWWNYAIIPVLVNDDYFNDNNNDNQDFDWTIQQHQQQKFPFLLYLSQLCRILTHLNKVLIIICSI